jgi:hypothetical protein
MIENAVCSALQCMLGILALSNYANAKSPDQPGDRQMNSVSNKQQGVSLVTSSEGKGRVGQALMISITIRNDNEESVIVDDFGDRPKCQLILIDRKTGTRCELTARGNKTFAHHSSQGGSQHANVTIKKGESRTWSVALGDYFVLRDGEFRLDSTVTFRTPEPEHSFDVTAKNLYLTISK